MEDKKNFIYRGKVGSKGIVIGKVHLHKKHSLEVEKRIVSGENISKEVRKLDQAFEETRIQIQNTLDKALGQLGEEQLGIFEAHLMMVSDPVLMKEIKNLIIDERVDAPYAIQKVIGKYTNTLKAMSNEYMKERVVDFIDIGEMLVANLLNKRQGHDVNINEPVIIVARELMPSDTINLDKDKVLGFVTQEGGETSHATILAKSLEVPFVYGIEDIALKVREGDVAVLDGIEGELIINPNQKQIVYYEKKAAEFIVAKQEQMPYKKVCAKMADGRPVKIVASIKTPGDVNSVLDYNLDGVGLFRTEFLYMNRDNYPSEEEQFEAYKLVAERLNPRPVTIRTIDIGGDKKLDYFKIPKEANPFLGWRGIRICLDNHKLFKTQLRAILRASEYGEIRIMYPMVSDLNELMQANSILREVKEELSRERIRYDVNIKSGIMIEVPSAAILADVLIAETDFFSIGTNDLCQYTLAVDRMNEKVSNLYKPCHPAILKMIKNIADAAHSHGKQIGLCGEMGGDPISSPLLVGLGVDELSMIPSSSLAVKKSLSQTSYDSAKEIAYNALCLKTAEEVEEYIGLFYKD